MSQVSWRAEPDLVLRVKQAAAERGYSMNEFITIVLDVATDPARARDEGSEIRERLRRAGLLVDDLAPVTAPDPSEIAEIRQRLEGELSLSDYISQGRS